ncbi:DMT family transporter [Candidatus Saccharibacteria bacterium]|nr:MAG: DMT family transporter [Candidatus Saccharibacteria bacterium]
MSSWWQLGEESGQFGTNRALYQSDHLRGITAALISAVASAAYIVINKYVYLHYAVKPAQYVPIFMIATGFYGLLNVVFHIWKQRGTHQKYKKGPSLFVYAVIISAGLGLVVVGQYFTSAVNSSIIFPAIIVWTAIFSWVLLRERFTRSQIIWCVVLFVGLYIAIVGFRSLTLHIGDLIVLVGTAFVGFSNAYSRPLIARVGSVVATNARVIVGALMAILIALFTLRDVSINSGVVIWALAAGFCLYIGARSFALATHLIDANHTSVINNMQIIFVGVLSVSVLGEDYSVEKLIGSLIVLTSIIFIAHARSRKTATK